MRQYAISLFIRRVYSFLQFQVIMVVNPIFGLFSNKFTQFKVRKQRFLKRIQSYTNFNYKPQ